MHVTRPPPHKLLAHRLAEIARCVAETHGDAVAQLATYGTLLKRWEPRACADVPTGISQADRVGQLLDATDLDKIHQHYSGENKDPVVYFYEEFLRAYAPATGKKRGVHYTPPEAVSFMVRAVETLLQVEMGQSVSEAYVVDPCCGIGTFLRHIDSHYVPTPRMLGVEMSQGAYGLASLLLPNAQIICRDWLEDIHIDAQGRTPVVIGNPPYSGHSANPGKAADLMRDYRLGLRERNPKWLQDDYVKFMRVAQHRIADAGTGTVAFITNHSYAFNPTFRSMRASLMQDFDLIYVLDLQGNAKRNDTLGAVDENIFPIQMGTAITLLVRTGASRPGRVFCAELRGSRKDKLATLAQAELSDLPWRSAEPAAPFNVFAASSGDAHSEYWTYPSVTDLFIRKSVGFVTSRDAFAVDVDRNALLRRIEMLRDSSVSVDELRLRFPIGDLDVGRARRQLQAEPEWRDNAVSVLYRPFDYRWAYLSRTAMERPRLPFMQSMLESNTAILVGRAGQATGSEMWDVVLCADRPADLNVFRRGGATILPRFTYAKGTREENIRCDRIAPDLLFPYIYALLHSASYRARYAAYLRFDYPRIPVSSDQTLVERLAALGNQLLEIHLLRTQPSPAHTDAELTIGGYPIPGKFIADRTASKLSEENKHHVEMIRRIAQQTMRLQHAVDDALQSRPPWND